MKLWLILGGLLAVLVQWPALAAALLGLLGTTAVWAACKPPVLGFAAGLLAAPRIRRWAR
jgi:hypothetical protein